MLTTTDRQAEHIRTLHQSLGQIENCLLNWQAQLDSMLREIHRLQGDVPPVQFDADDYA